MLSLYCADDVIKLVTTTIIIVIIFLSDNYSHNEISLGISKSLFTCKKIRSPLQDGFFGASDVLFG